MDAGPRIDSYQWAGGREAMLRWGPENGPVVVVALPLFEEANRTRATLTAMLQALAARGIAGAVPDLPGTGESLLATADVRLADWRAAFAAATAALPGLVHVVAVRGGALVAGEANAASRWYLSPQSGDAVVRELRRVQAIGQDESFAGNHLSDDLLSTFQAAKVSTMQPSRVVRLTGDPRPADAILAMPPPWRTAEPHRNDALANLLADDVAHWIAQCGG